MTHRRFHVLVAAALGAASVTISACRVENDARAGAARMLGVTVPGRDTAFFRQLESGLRDAALRHGYEITVLRARDLKGQQSDIDTFMTQHVDAIVVAPVDSVRIGSAIAKANSLRVPVFTIAKARNARAEGVQTIQFVSDYFDGKLPTARRKGPVRLVYASVPATPGARR